MAISRVNSSKSASASSPISFNAGTSDLVVAIVYRVAGGTVTNPQWNGVSMSTQYSASLPSTNNVYVFYKLGGATGTNNFSWTGGASDVILVSYSGVKQTGFPDASVSITPGTLSGTQTATLTTVADNAWQILAYFSADGATTSAGTGSTLVQTQITGGGGVSFFDSNAGLSPAGSKSMSITLSASARSSIHSFSIAPVPNTFIPLIMMS